MGGRIIAVALVFATCVSGCASSAWRHARLEDSISGYHSFLKEHPDSRFSDEARARLDLSRLKKHPTRAAVDTFRQKYSAPDLTAELVPFVEDLFFRHTRAVGTAQAYRDFLEQHPSGPLSERAKGNLVYLENEGYGPDVDALARFAADHPASDYAAEAKRSVSAMQLRKTTGFEKLGVFVDVNSSTPGADRLRRVFRDRATAAYAAAGIAAEVLSAPGHAREAKLPVLLTIRHDEREVSATLDKGKMSEPAIVARTEVKLERVDTPKTIWLDAFEHRAPVAARRDDVSILFGPNSASSYWADSDGEFFVPVARWDTRSLAKRTRSFAKSAFAVDVAGTRAVVLFGDGDFQVLDLGDPEDLVTVAHYRRDRDLSKFEGVRIDGERIAVFGSDGIELVTLDGEDARREHAWGRDRVGSVVDAEWVDGAWLIATNRGLLRIGSDSDAVRTLVARPILGMARGPDDRILFTDGTSLFAGSLTMLESGRAEELRLGRGFRPERVRARGHTAVVLGARDAVQVDLSGPTPRTISRITAREAGRIVDVSIIGNRLFLIGPRGLQVLDAAGERVVDSVDVDARHRVEAEGRHLVVIGDKLLQVVDATPFIAATPAAPER